MFGNPWTTGTPYISPFNNYSNKKLMKTNLLFHVLGDMDELSSSLGLAYHHSTMKDEIRIIQTVLQKINSVIATDDYSKLNEEFFGEIPLEFEFEGVEYRLELG